MFLRAKTRFKDGKPHRYWSIVENRRTRGKRVVQRQVLYLGEINDSQRAAWCRSIEALHEGGEQRQQIALFPDDRPVPALEYEVVQIQLSGLQLHHPGRRCTSRSRSNFSIRTTSFTCSPAAPGASTKSGRCAAGA